MSGILALDVDYVEWGRNCFFHSCSKCHCAVKKLDVEVDGVVTTRVSCTKCQKTLQPTDVVLSMKLNVILSYVVR